jgi:hypothetical protein
VTGEQFDVWVRPDIWKFAFWRSVNTRELTIFPSRRACLKNRPCYGNSSSVQFQ